MPEKTDAKSSEQPKSAEQKAAEQAAREGRSVGEVMAEQSADKPRGAKSDFRTRLQEADPKNEDRAQDAERNAPLVGVPHGGGQAVGSSTHPEVQYWLAELETARLNGNDKRREVIADELRAHGYEVG